MNTQQVTDLINKPICVGVLGYGELGQAATRLLAPKREMLWVATPDQKGYACATSGLNSQKCEAIYKAQGSYR